MKRLDLEVRLARVETLIDAGGPPKGEMSPELAVNHTVRYVIETHNALVELYKLVRDLAREGRLE